MFKKTLDFAQAGDDCGILLRGITNADVKRGMLLTKPGLTTVHRNCKAEVYVLTESEGGRKSPFFTGYKPTLYLITNLVLYKNC
jgi:elongation factor Tu